MVSCFFVFFFDRGEGEEAAFKTVALLKPLREKERLAAANDLLGAGAKKAYSKMIEVCPGSVFEGEGPSRSFFAGQGVPKRLSS